MSHYDVKYKFTQQPPEKQPSSLSLALPMFWFDLGCPEGWGGRTEGQLLPPGRWHLSQLKDPKGSCLSLLRMGLPRFSKSIWDRYTCKALSSSVALGVWGIFIDHGPGEATVCPSPPSTLFFALIASFPSKRILPHSFNTLLTFLLLLLPACSTSSPFLPEVFDLLGPWQLQAPSPPTQSPPMEYALGLPSPGGPYIPRPLWVLCCFSRISVSQAPLLPCPFPWSRLESSELIATFPEDKTKKVRQWPSFLGQKSQFYLLVGREIDRLLASTARWGWTFGSSEDVTIPRKNQIPQNSLQETIPVSHCQCWAVLQLYFVVCATMLIKPRVNSTVYPRAGCSLLIHAWDECWWNWWAEVQQQVWDLSQPISGLFLECGS